MPKAIETLTPTSGSSRRVMLGFTSAAVLSGLVAPVLASPAEPDAELIALCAAHVANIRAYNTISDDNGWDRCEAAYTLTQRAIDEAEPKTMAGMLAIARAAKAEALQPDGTENASNCPAEDWAWNLVNDLLRLHGGQA